jgi:hypothetical protein
MAQQSGAEAKTRRAEGGRVHSVVVELGFRAGAVDNLSDVIENVEAAGWALDQVKSVTTESTSKVLLIFRAV